MYYWIDLDIDWRTQSIDRIDLISNTGIIRFLFL